MSMNFRPDPAPGAEPDSRPGHADGPEPTTDGRTVASTRASTGTSIGASIGASTVASTRASTGTSAIASIGVPTEAPAAAPADAEDLGWMQVALDASIEAFERGDWPTGAALVRDGRLLATGQNRQETLRDVTVHAEVDAIRAALAAHGPGATVGATLYCTMEPCPMCAGALKLAGVSRLVLALRHRTLRRTDLGRYDIESFCAMTGWHPSLTEGVLGQEYLALRRRWGRDAVAPPPKDAAGDTPDDRDEAPVHRR